MTEMIDSLLMSIAETRITLGSTMVRLLLGLVLGLCIGAERQFKRRDAGLRTFTLICLGSACAVVISIWIPQIYPDLLNGDPGRIAAQVLTGVGFLGAGAIVKSKGGVQGLTTAACIWQTSIIGMTAGAGLYLGAIVLTAMTLFVLVTVDRIERLLRIDGDNYIMTIRIEGTMPDVDRLKSAASLPGVRVKTDSLSIDNETDSCKVTLRLTLGSRACQDKLVKSVSAIEKVKSVSLSS